MRVAELHQAGAFRMLGKLRSKETLRIWSVFLPEGRIMNSCDVCQPSTIEEGKSFAKSGAGQKALYGGLSQPISLLLSGPNDYIFQGFNSTGFCVRMVLEIVNSEGFCA
jgi:hypothetical protein